jgi:hypothetical protein
MEDITRGKVAYCLLNIQRDLTREVDVVEGICNTYEEIRISYKIVGQ